MQTLVDLLSEAARVHGTAPALTMHGRDPWTWSYEEL